MSTLQELNMEMTASESGFAQSQNHEGESSIKIICLIAGYITLLIYVIGLFIEQLDKDINGTGNYHSKAFLMGRPSLYVKDGEQHFEHQHKEVLNHIKMKS